MQDDNSDKEQRGRPCGEGDDGLRTGVGDELPAVGSQALVHAVGAARVSSRRAQTRCLPRYGLCTRMKDEGCEHKVETFFARLTMVLKPEKESTVKRWRSACGRVEGVFAWCRCPSCILFSLDSTAADCSPEPIPDRGAEPNLFIAGSP